ncbi:MAG: hybrid sensor histidine kinase/response regulator [Elusimicrobiota bacterium]|jgi:signal transduction histidine kinase
MDADVAKPAVLLVEDGPEHRALVEAALADEDYRFLTASTGNEALEMLREEPGDLPVLLIDLSLPDMDGLEVLRAVQERDPEAVAIVLTASNTEEAASRSLRAGAFDFLVKPCGYALLRAAVSRAVVHRRLQKNLREAKARLEAAASGLRERDEQWSSSLADLTHELRNPLTIISGYTGFLLDKAETEGFSPRVRRGLSAVFASAKQLQGLSEDVLDMVRLAHHRLRVQPEDVSVPAFLDGVVETHSLRAEGKGVALAADCLEKGDFSVRADPRRLRQVFDNLLSNALKFTLSGGRVSLRARPQGEWVWFCVQDTGVGIPLSAHSRIFQRYCQAHAPQENPDGMGIGLELSKRLVELQGGRIWVQSEEGRGTRFEFTLPSA